MIREQLEAEPTKKGAHLDKIIEGKVKKRLAELCLLQQNHMVETGNPVVEKFLKQLSNQLKSEIQLVDYALWTVGQ